MLPKNRGDLILGSMRTHTLPDSQTNIRCHPPILHIPPYTASRLRRTVTIWAKKSALFSTVAYVFDLQKNKRKSRRLAESTYVEGRLSGDSLRAMSWALARIREACASEGARLACVYVASFEDVRADQDGGARMASRDLCAELGIPFLDLTPGLRLRGGSVTERLYFEHDMHWSDEGNAVVAATSCRWCACFRW
jgi:hypothetical protein